MRSVARIAPAKRRRMRSSSRLVTESSRLARSFCRRSSVARAPRRFEGRVELRLEELPQDGCNRGVRGEHLLHVGLAERPAGLQHVTAVGAQYGHLSPGHFRDDDQAIESVVLGAAAPDCGERVVESRAELFRVDRPGVASLHFHVLQPDRPAARDSDAIRALAQHHESHVLEQRQRLRQGNRRCGAEQSQVNRRALARRTGASRRDRRPT